MNNFNPFMSPLAQPSEPDNNCLVTMLYDLKAKEPNRQFGLDFYLEHSKHILNLDVFMVIFVENEYIKKQVLSQRDIHTIRQGATHSLLEKTCIIIKPFDELKHADKISEIDSKDKINPIANMSPEINNFGKNSPRYRVVGWNKFELLKEAIQLDPFKSKRWGWIDFGIGYRAQMPSNINNIVNCIGDKVKVGIYNRLVIHNVWSKDFYRREKRMWDAGFFAGKKENMIKFIELFDKELERILTKEQIAPLEDQICVRVFMHNPDIFLMIHTPNHEQIFVRWMQ